MLDSVSVTVGIFRHIVELTPPSLHATSPIFLRCKTQGRSVEIFQRLCFTGVLSSPMLRLLLLSIADEEGEKPMLDSVSVTVGIFRHIVELTPPSLHATSPIFLRCKTQRRS